jgi:hypothetical protein
MEVARRPGQEVSSQAKRGVERASNLSAVHSSVGIPHEQRNSKVPS